MRKTIEKKGITLISLVITIIILLILSTIVIGTLTGDNGLILQALNAKESAEVDTEKEIVEISAVQTMGKDKFGTVSKTGLQNVAKRLNFYSKFLLLICILIRIRNKKLW